MGCGRRGERAQGKAGESGRMEDAGAVLINHCKKSEPFCCLHTFPIPSAQLFIPSQYYEMIYLKWADAEGYNKCFGFLLML